MAFISRFVFLANSVISKGHWLQLFDFAGLISNRQAMMQVCYSATLLDTVARRNSFASAQVLAGALRGRAVVLASGAQAAFQLRGPADAANLASLIGLNSKQAKVRQRRAMAPRVLH